MAQADSVGPEALLKASADCKLRLVRLLVDGGTDVNVKSSSNETPMILACKSESTEKEKIVEFLIKHRAKVNRQDVHGKTALIYACLTNSSENLIRMLVNARANPWVKDDSKNTAFDYAINERNIGTVKVMIEACREGKVLSKPGSFNMEMRRLEDKLDQLPETRKWSWPLMGPRSSVHKEKKVSHQSDLLAVKEDDEIESPKRERRRKKSICRFDPIDIDPDKSQESTDSFPIALRQGSLYSIGRSSSEDEKISLHFSDSDNSSFEVSSVHFSSLERLIKLRDSLTSSVESNESLNAQTSAAIKLDAARNPDKQKTSSVTSIEKEESELSLGGRGTNEQNFNDEHLLSETQASYDYPGSSEIEEEEEKIFCFHVTDSSFHGEKQFTSSPSPLLERKMPYLRRKSVGSVSESKGEKIESEDIKKPVQIVAPRRVTVSTMESSMLVAGCVSSPESKLNRKKIRPPEIDMASKNKDAPCENLTCNFPDVSTQKPIKFIQADSFKFTLPIISKPDEQESRNEPNGKRLTVKSNEKTSVRRTLSDSMCQRTKAHAITTRSDNRLGVGRNEVFTSDSRIATSQVHTGYRERSASSPITPPSAKSPQALSTRCDSTIKFTSRSPSPRYTFAGDLPDLVLHSPTFSRPSSMETLKHELQVSNTRLGRSVSPEIIGNAGENNSKLRSNSFSNPSEVSVYTESLKDKRVARLPPLNISRRSNDLEEGYFSCSPSPLDLESPNRYNEKKSRYTFKPLSPRIVTRPVKNVLP